MNEANYQKKTDLFCRQKLTKNKYLLGSYSYVSVAQVNEINKFAFVKNKTYCITYLLCAQFSLIPTTVHYQYLFQARDKILHSDLAIPLRFGSQIRVQFAGEATHHRYFASLVGRWQGRPERKIPTYLHIYLYSHSGHPHYQKSVCLSAKRITEMCVKQRRTI